MMLFNDILASGLKTERAFHPEGSYLDEIVWVSGLLRRTAVCSGKGFPHNLLTRQLPPSTVLVRTPVTRRTHFAKAKSFNWLRCPTARRQPASSTRGAKELKHYISRPRSFREAAILRWLKLLNFNESKNQSSIVEAFLFCFCLFVCFLFFFYGDVFWAKV